VIRVFLQLFSLVVSGFGKPVFDQFFHFLFFHHL
jgi:hypothetical protein